MQTTFTLAQLADPNIAEADKILRACVHCGFCTATCPTYVLLGDELDSPRGRIYLIKQMFEQDRDATEVEARHLDRCLSCLACMTTCPSGVHYMHLVDQAREHVEKTYVRPASDRWMRRLLATIVPNPTLFRLALAGASLAKLVGAQHWLPRRLRAMVGLAQFPAAPRPTDRPGLFPAQGQRRGRVAILAGCAQPVLRPEINEAAMRLLNRLGIEVVVAEGAGCCGSLTHHMGLEDAALASAKANIAAWHREIEAGGLDAILVTTSGCGTTIKDYGYLFRSDPVWRERAQAVSERALDITEYLAKLGLPPMAAPQNLRLAYHAACSLQHGQKVTEAPKQLLREAGFTVLTVPEGHLCCGSAGTYNMLQPELSQRLRDRKAANIKSLAPDLVATGNIGCMQQLEDAVGVPILHTVELLDWAHGGPKSERFS
ncbi:MAG: glycolate oxidase subunit GlcF [Rhodospirillaceae bacterium]|jgi:glycolate oxidase iron-sulfur subunit|nr:glycolate oxidase subunit GlcF [Rhodospirillaceae bacterium]